MKNPMLTFFEHDLEKQMTKENVPQVPIMKRNKTFAQSSNPPTFWIMKFKLFDNLNYSWPVRHLLRGSMQIHNVK